MTSCAACFFQITASVTHLELLTLLRVGRWCLKSGVVGYSIRLFYCIHGRAIIQTPHLSCPNPVSSFLRFSSRSSRLPAFRDWWFWGFKVLRLVGFSTRCGLRPTPSLPDIFILWHGTPTLAALFHLSICQPGSKNIFRWVKGHFTLVYTLKTPCYQPP